MVYHDRYDAKSESSSPGRRSPLRKLSLTYHRPQLTILAEWIRVIREELGFLTSNKRKRML